MAGNEPRACGRPLQHAPALDHLKSSSMPVTSIGVASASETGGPAEETIVWEGWLDKQDPNGILYKQWKRRCAIVFMCTDMVDLNAIAWVSYRWHCFSGSDAALMRRSSCPQVFQAHGPSVDVRQNRPSGMLLAAANHFGQSERGLQDPGHWAFSGWWLGAGR